MTDTRRDIIIRCAVCTAPIDGREIELNEECQIVCRDCYLSSVPQCDIDGAMWDLEMATWNGVASMFEGRA